ncbi:MAG TPA: nucleoside 2-deoxyribosyltransferase [Tepidisphaeraceae bacterium]|nr:nucleoside 2-deoxyribosyltransferase [Tepidisphaeraceae bacterium]
MKRQRRKSAPARPRIYLAGPEVFLANAAEIGQAKCRLCAKYGFEGIYPIDPEIDFGKESTRQTAYKIGLKNEELMQGCDGVIANMTPFRGPSADLGTAFEMGYVRALGRLVCAYSNVPDGFMTRTQVFLKGAVSQTEDGRIRDGDGMALEDWELADNLMLESAIVGSGGCFIVGNAPPGEMFTCLKAFERCLRRIKSKGLLIAR